MSRGFDAVLVAGFGGPESAAEVPEFLRRASGGRIPAARLVEVGRHYGHFGGVSPVNAQHRELAAQLAGRLAVRGLEVPVVCGNRHARPYFAEVLGELLADGRRRILVVVPAPYASYSGCRAYREELFAALPCDAAGPLLEVVKLAPYPRLPGLVAAQVEILRPVLAAQPAAQLVFTTHSIPVAMAESSGPAGRAYVAQHLELIAQVLAGLAADGLRPRWRLAYQSRSGAPQTAWLEPDINDALRESAAAGVRQVVCSPIGFLTDHMEVIWDLDHEAAATCAELGIGFTRVPTVGGSAVFLDALADRVAAVLAGAGSGSGFCGANCCPHPGAAPQTIEGV